MRAEMDIKDEQILSILHEDSSLSTQKIAKKTLIPITTVHNRIKKLKESGIIKQYTIKVDEKKLGRHLFSYILINADSKELKTNKSTQEKLAKKLKMLKEVDSSSIITGESDLLIKVGVKDVDELNDFIIKKLRHIDGVESTRTMIVLKEV